jgi:hypothetical protein
LSAEILGENVCFVIDAVVKWLLVSFIDGGDTGPGVADSKSLLVQLRSLERQFRSRGLQVVVATDPSLSVTSRANYVADRQLGEIPLIDADASPERTRPVTLLISPDMRVAARWTGFGNPARMGLALRSLLAPETPAHPALD